MRAAVLHGVRDLRVEERPIPRPGPGEVLVEVSHCGVCGTDLHMVVEGWGRPGSIGGHEWSGHVAAVGDGVERFAVGDAVVGGPSPTCGTCRSCAQGRPSLCEARATPGTGVGDGAFADFVCVDQRALIAVPVGLELRTAALAEPLAVALHAVTISGVGPGQRALVVGAGPIGVLAVVALRARGVSDIVVSEPNPARQALATAVGASQVVAPEDLEVPSIAEPRRMVDEWVHVALECSGRAPAMEAACAQLGRAGCLVLVGTGIEPPRFDPNRILLNELVITGAYEYDLDGIEQAVALLADGVVDVADVAAPDEVGLGGLLTAMEDLIGGAIAGKVLVAPNLREDP